MDKLVALDSYRSSHRTRLHYDRRETGSPLKIDEWSQALGCHPDQHFAQYITDGLKQGFRVGINRQCHCSPATTNLHSEQPQIIHEYLLREVCLGRMLHFQLGDQPEGIQISPIGVIPKKNKPGKWRLITDSEERSVNDAISTEYSSLKYPSIDHLSSLVLEAGRSSYLVKADIQEAYRNVPVHPDDQLFLGILWEKTVYIDKMLPFGLRSAPIIFSAVADALQWVLINNGISRLLHYLDDFILVADSKQQAEDQKQILVSTCERLGVPLELSKLEGPSTCLTFLGIEVDTVAMQIRLPGSKLKNLKEELSKALQEVSKRGAITKKALESLTGLLQFATKVVRPGRPFLRRLYALKDVGSLPSHHIRLNAPARADLLWWHLFADRWNGISMLWDLKKYSVDITVYSDASGSWGCGAWWNLHWFNFQWPDRFREWSIAVKELFPVVVAAALYGPQWSGKIVQFVVDNLAVVQVLNSTYSSNNHLMHLIRLLVFLASYHNFWFSSIHIAGKNNSLADALSRNNLHFFHSQVPKAPPSQPRIPSALISLLSQNLTWTSTAWIRQFSAIIQQP